MQACTSACWDRAECVNVDVWTHNPDLAQNFFEHELTKLYTRKFGGKVNEI